MPKITITVLVENVASGPGLIAEAGLSLWIEHNGRRILFDTGRDTAISNNIKHLGVDLAQADTVVLSHGHYDHTDGMANILADIEDKPLYIHPEAFGQKYSLNREGPARYIGIAPEVADFIRKKNRVVPTAKPTQISEGVFVTGTIPRANDFEDTGGKFYEDPEGTKPDGIADDQAMYIESEESVTVILGCAHSGVINTLNYIKSLTSGKPVKMLLGGMHLLNADDNRLDKTMTELRQMDIERLLPCHCTGVNVIAQMKKEFPDQFGMCRCGDVITIES